MISIITETVIPRILLYFYHLKILNLDLYKENLERISVFQCT